MYIILEANILNMIIISIYGMIIVAFTDITTDALSMY